MKGNFEDVVVKLKKLEGWRGGRTRAKAKCDFNIKKFEAEEGHEETCILQAPKQYSMLSREDNAKTQE